MTDAIEALKACQKLFNEALPKFNWGASFLDANAIKLLNEVPPLVEQALDSPVGWKWMTHPERNNGKPIPVKFFTQDGVEYYQPFDEQATEFEASIMSTDWKVVS